LGALMAFGTFLARRFTLEPSTTPFFRVNRGFFVLASGEVFKLRPAIPPIR